MMIARKLIHSRKWLCLFRPNCNTIIDKLELFYTYNFKHVNIIIYRIDTIQTQNLVN